MNGTRKDHLTEEEILGYCEPPGVAEGFQQLEEHYLECGTCFERVKQTEDLLGGLRRLRAGRMAVVPRRAVLPWAAAAVLAVGASALLLELRRTRETLMTERQARASATPAPPRESTPARGDRWAQLGLDPPLRGLGAQILTVPPDVAFVVLRAATGEAGAPGTVFEASLHKEREVVLTLSAVRSNREGTVELACPRELLNPGEYALELRGPHDLLVVPFRVSPAGAPLASGLRAPQGEPISTKPAQ